MTKIPDAKPAADGGQLIEISLLVEDEQDPHAPPIVAGAYVPVSLEWLRRARSCGLVGENRHGADVQYKLIALSSLTLVIDLMSMYQAGTSRPHLGQLTGHSKTIAYIELNNELADAMKPPVVIDSFTVQIISVNRRAFAHLKDYAFKFRLMGRVSNVKRRLAPYVKFSPGTLGAVMETLEGLPDDAIVTFKGEESEHEQA